MVDIHGAYSKNMFGRGYSAETVRFLEMRRAKEREIERLIHSKNPFMDPEWNRLLEFEKDYILKKRAKQREDDIKCAIFGIGMIVSLAVGIISGIHK